MPSLNFTISPDNVSKLHDALSCLAKFNESVSIEAFQSRALLSVFKGRLVESKDKDTGIDRCEVTLQDRSDKTECRLIVKIICKHGVIKTYRLTYESVGVMSAVFDKKKAVNRWTMKSGALREFIEYFGPGTDQLEIYPDAGRAIFSSFREKVTNGREVLKQPLNTSVAIETSEFEEFWVEDNLHVIINVKDFKAIVSHADTLHTIITARYSHARRPMQISYDDDGMLCDFILMTTGDARGTSASPAPSTRLGGSTTRSNPRSSIPVAGSRTNVQITSNSMPPPPPPQSTPRTVPNAPQEKPQPPNPDSKPPRQSLESSLFFPAEDEDRQWDEQQYEEEEEEDMLGWDASAEHNTPGLLFGDPDRTRSQVEARDSFGAVTTVEGTQRISQLRGLFDDE
ncbi:MAG: hypothetical protein M1834_006667 [Cirrosporium novae-zelandiae]|nr:MAG: hypothetical protein M1834_006667 [Cirrosporium novae-zelandiae]